MNPDFEHRAEQALLQAVRQRRRRRQHIRLALATTGCVLLGALALTLQRPPATSVAKPESIPVAVQPPPPTPAFASIHETVASTAGSHATLRTIPSSTLVIVHTSETVPLIKLDEHELFALLPDASIRIGPDQRQELILPQ